MWFSDITTDPFTTLPEIPRHALIVSISGSFSLPVPTRPGPCWKDPGRIQLWDTPEAGSM